MYDGSSQESVKRARAFNAGCDARLAGWPITGYPRTGNELEEFYWRAGWKDVDRYYGIHARWPINRLPDVIEVCRCHANGVPRTSERMQATAKGQVNRDQ